MKRPLIYKILLTMCLACFCAGPVSARAFIPSDTPPAGQMQFVPVMVNGRVLTGPNSSASRRDGMILIPVTAIARALGDIVSVDLAKRAIYVQRQTGTTADLDIRLGSVRENGAVILMVASSGEIVLSPNAEEQMLPIEIAAALFDTSVRFDSVRNIVIVTRGLAATGDAVTRGKSGVAALYQLDYEYNLNKYSSGASHDLNINAAGRLGDGRFSLSSNTSGVSLAGISVRNAAFHLERPNGQQYFAGDFGTGTDLEFLSAMIRGGGVTVPVKGMRITAFAGRAYSGSISPIAGILIPHTAVRDRFRYDTNVFGGSVSSTSADPGRRPGPFEFSAGAMRFSGDQRSGDVASASVNYSVSRLRLEGDLAYGKFSGFRPDNTHFNGAGVAIDLTGTYQASQKLSLQARYTHIGTNFLTPQSGLREPVDMKAAGVTWSPTKWFSTSVNASTSRRPGTQAQDNRFVTAAFNITPGAGLPRLYLSHTQTTTGYGHAAAFTMLTASKEYSRLRLYTTATRTSSFGTSSASVQSGANYMVNDRSSVEVSQGIGTGGMLNGQADWRMAGLFDKRLSFTAGAGYSHSRNSGFTPYERLSASLTLPRQTSLEVSYFQSSAGPTLLVSVKGSLFRRREAAAYLGAPTESMNSFAKASGRVYQDVNLNGRFDPGVDLPQADVQVRVDGNRYVVTDAEGMYRFDSVIAGDHSIYLDLLSVRADLTLLNGAEKRLALDAGSDSQVDFRLVRTGRLSGRVWMDANENGKFDEGETPLSDIRIITGSGRDTLTDNDGYFIIGDLPPGEHVVLIDEKTLPEKTSAASKPLAIQVFPGRETPDIPLAVIKTPAEIKHFGTKITN